MEHFHPLPISFLSSPSEKIELPEWGDLEKLSMLGSAPSHSPPSEFCLCKKKLYPGP